MSQTTAKPLLLKLLPSEAMHLWRVLDSVITGTSPDLNRNERTELTWISNRLSTLVREHVASKKTEGVR